MSNRYRGKRKKKRGIFEITLWILFVLVVGTWVVVGKSSYDRNHFDEGTTINGVDCSKLTVEEAKDKLKEQKIALAFSETFSYADASTIGRTISNVSELENFLHNQKVEKSGEKDYKLSQDSYQVNEEVIKQFLSGKEDFNNVTYSQDAYMQWDEEERLIEIVPEVYGKGSNLDEACEFAKEALLRGEDMIDFTKMKQKEPEVTELDLYLKAQLINDLLKSVIQFEFKDGSTYVIDYNMTKKWICYDEVNGIYKIDDNEFNKGITEVLDVLSEKVRELGYSMEYVTPEGESVRLPVQWGSYDTLDRDAENMAIRKMLLIGRTFNSVEPIYSKINDISKFDSYVTISISEQRLRAYENGKVKYDFPVITGMKGVSDTPKGVFYSNWRATHYYLSGPEVWVEYWLTVDGNVGIHDADNWRDKSEYTQDRYTWDGSNACINMKRKDVVFIYDYIQTSTPIIIY